jgi:HAD superfamily hydrolase (TIGR01509 family)
MNNIGNYKNIIFDLGGVILNLDYNKTVEEYKKHIQNLDEVVFFGKENQLSFFSEYEVGKISTDVFRQKFNSYYDLELSKIEFSRCWNAMIFDFPIQRIYLIEKLRNSGRRVYLLSNINELHELAVEDSFSKLGLNKRFFDSFDKVYFSHRVGLRKPNWEIFDLVIKENNIKKEETVFIDDSLHHVMGSRNFGIHAIHLTKPVTVENLPLFSGVL